LASVSSSAARYACFASVSAMRSCGRRGPAIDGHHGAEVELDRVGEHRVGRLVGAEEPLLARVRLDERDLLLAAAREAEVVERLGVDREEAHRRAVLGRHVRDGRAVGERHGAEPRAVELDELAHDLLLAEHLGDREAQVRRGRAGRQPPRDLEADHLGDEHRERLAQHRRLGLDAAHAPAEHAEAVDHRGVRVGADERVGVGERAPSPPSAAFTNTTLARYSTLTWWMMPVPGGTALKLSSAPCAQRSSA
jgi:hypothetical protein